MRINSRECQPLFREILAKPKNELQGCESSEVNIIAQCVWKYNTRENESLQDQYINRLKKDDELISFYWPQYKDRSPEIAMIILKRLKSPKIGYFAAEALKKLTGKQFQYTPPASEWARNKANENVRKTSMSPEEI